MATIKKIDVNSVDGLRTVLTDPAVYVISEDNTTWNPGTFKMEPISKVDVATVFSEDAIIVRLEK